jgi:lysophospholipase L1-like esterase
MLALLCFLVQANIALAAKKPTIYVFLLSGQSNMVGLGIPGELSTNYLAVSTNVIIKAGGNPNKGWGNLASGYGANGTYFGPELAFGYDISTKRDGEKIALIKFSEGGKNLCADYRPPSSGGTPGPLYVALTNFAKAALAELSAEYEIKLSGIGWMQGESDAMDITCAKAYRSNLNNFIHDLRRDLGVGPIPFIIGMIDEQPLWKHGDMVRQAGIEAAQAITNVSVFGTKGLATDGMHYTSAGLIELGRLFAKHASTFLPLHELALERGTAIVPSVIRAVGDWEIEVVATNHGPGELRRAFSVLPPQWRNATNDLMPQLEEWKTEPGWARQKIPGLIEGLNCARFVLDEHSVVARSSTAADAIVFEPEKDYRVDVEWCGIGRMAGGQVSSNQPVYLSYRYQKRRLDSVVLNRSGQLELRRGEPHISMPVPPPLAVGEIRVANIFVPENLKQLGLANFFPILESSFPELHKSSPSEAERLLPNTVAKLRNGEPLKILAWGDSVTQGYLGEDQWQSQFVRRLRDRFPKADIHLVTVGWGAHNSQHFLDAPPGHAGNFAEKVLGAKPDLVVSEFVNDVPLDVAKVEQNYRKFLADFQAIGAEWIILTPHYSTFMNWPSERDLDDDPRAYVKMLRRFAPENQVALADAAARYGRLWRQGIPYSTLMVNTVNHPDARGMAIFADSLMALFP